jgi:hypothetical protein
MVQKENIKQKDEGRRATAFKAGIGNTRTAAGIL